MATVITDQDFDEVVVQSKIPVLVDFFAEWCGPCKMLSPIMDELAPEYEGKVKIVKMDVDASPETPQKFGVMSIPTLIFFKDGEEVERLTGALPKDNLAAKLDEMAG